MNYFPIVREKPKPKNEPIPLYQEVESPDNFPYKKEREEEKKEERGVVIIQL